MTREQRVEAEPDHQDGDRQERAGRGQLVDEALLNGRRHADQVEQDDDQPGGQDGAELDPAPPPPKGVEQERQRQRDHQEAGAVDLGGDVDLGPVQGVDREAGRQDAGEHAPESAQLARRGFRLELLDDLLGLFLTDRLVAVDRQLGSIRDAGRIARGRLGPLGAGVGTANRHRPTPSRHRARGRRSPRRDGTGSTNR
jgi:hypothetical protein